MVHHTFNRKLSKPPLGRVPGLPGRVNLLLCIPQWQARSFAGGSSRGFDSKQYRSIIKNCIAYYAGGFSQVLKDLREELIKFSALIELELDFSQEDVEFADRKQLYQLIDKLTETTNQLLNSFKLGNVIRNGVVVAIIGKPNAGKSTLLNSLLNENRAIVSDIAGTTRDTIEELLNIEGIIFRLADTAGLREHTSDVIEKFGVERSVAKMEQADIVLYLFDVNTMEREELQQVERDYQRKGLNYVLVGNKSDIVSDGNEVSKLAAVDFISISAKDHINLSALKERLVSLVTGGSINTENTIITNSRHYEALQQVSQSLNEIRAGLDNKLPGDLLALDIRRCLHYLGEITGEITNEDSWILFLGSFVLESRLT